MARFLGIFLGSRSHMYLYWPGNEYSMAEAEVTQLSHENVTFFLAISLAPLNFERQRRTESQANAPRPTPCRPGNEAILENGIIGNFLA